MCVKNKNQTLALSVYRSLMETAPIPTVDVIFLDKTRTKILLFKRRNEPVKNIYFTIGGRLQKNEKLVVGAKRVVKQETGIALDQKKLEGPHVTEDIHANSRFPETNYHAVAVFFFCPLEKGTENKIKLDQQHSDYRWFSIKDRSLHKYIKNRLSALL